MAYVDVRCVNCLEKRTNPMVLLTGTDIILSSPIGKMVLPVRITEGIMEGTVSLNEGLWPELILDHEVKTETAGSVNMLTSTEPTQPSGSSRTHTVFVQVVSNR